MQYKCVLHGLKGYSPAYLNTLTEKERKQIIYRSEKAWKIINQLKQRKLNRAVKHILHQVMPDIGGGSACLLVEPVYDSSFVVNNNLEELKVDRDEIIRELVSAKVLPENFYEL